MSTPLPASLSLRKSVSYSLPLSTHEDVDEDGDGPLPFGSSAELVASMDPWGDDVAGWINDLLDDGEDEIKAGKGLEEAAIDLPKLDTQVRSLLNRLSGISQDTSTQLEQTIHDISRTVPRLTYDLQFMRESAATLRTSLRTVESRTDNDSSSSIPSYLSHQDPETQAVLERLSHLDTIQTNMTTTLSILQLASSWSTLESDIATHLSSSPPSFQSAADRLATAATSLSVFTHNPSEHASRKALLASLQNRLEAGMSAEVVKAIGKGDKEGCKAFFGMFGMIEREGEFRGYYYGARRAALVDMWTGAKLADVGGSTGAIVADANTLIPFTTFLPQFYASLLSLLHEERTLLPSIFPDPQATLSALLQSIFDALNPSLPQRLESLVEFHGSERALTELVKAFKATEDAAVGIKGVMERLSYAGGVGAAAAVHASPKQIGEEGAAAAKETNGTSSPARSRSGSRRYSRMSISHPPSKASASADSNIGGGPWEAALFEPFLDFQSNYPTLERQLLSYQLNRELASSSSASSLVSSSSKDAASDTDPARLIWDQSISLFTFAESALERCLALTHGYGSAGLVEVLNEFLAAFLERSEGLFEREMERKEERKRKKADARKKRLEGSGIGLGGGEGRDELDELDEMDNDEEDVDGTDYSSEDWATFQLALHLLGTARAIRDRLTAFEGRLTLSLSQVAQAFAAAREDPIGMGMIGGSVGVGGTTTRGGIEVLRGSALNSRELGELMDGLMGVKSGGGPNSAAAIGTLTTASASSPSARRTSISTSLHPQSYFHSHLPHLYPTTSHQHSLPPPHLLSPSLKSLQSFTRSSQLFLQQTILSPLHALLASYPRLPIYSTPLSSSSDNPSSTSSKKKSAAANSSIPTFSVTPTDVISRVGEGLLNLPRLFEVYANDDALAFSLETLPFIDLEALKELMHPFAAAAGEDHVAGGAGGGGPLLSPNSISPLHSPTSLLPQPPSMPHRRSSSQSILNNHQSAAPLPPPAPVALSPETVTTLHLSCLTLSLLSHITTTTLPAMPDGRLSDRAIAQLASDLGYLVNVVRAYEVEWSEGESWREALETKEEEVSRRLDGGVLVRGEGSEEKKEVVKVEGKERKILETVAKMRGIAIA